MSFKYSEIELAFLADLKIKVKSAYSVDSSGGKLTWPNPLNIIDTLSDWGLPGSLIEAAAWSCTIKEGGINNFKEYLPDNYAHLSNQLNKVFWFFVYDLQESEKRIPHQLEQIYKNLLERFWPDVPTLLLSSLFYTTLKDATNNSERWNKTRLVTQARTVFDPLISKRFGMWAIHRSLLSLALKLESPSRYDEYIDDLEQIKTTNVDPFVERITSLVKKANASVKNHQYDLLYDLAYPYKVALVRNTKNRLSPQDLVSFVILLSNEQDCKDFLWTLQKLGNLGGSIRDYISKPKHNGYRSIHAKVDLPGLGKIRFFIRTTEMHNECNYGYLNKWRLGEKNVSSEDLLPQMVKDRICVYSRTGQPYILPKDASPLDLAFTINTTMGYRFKGARVFGRNEIVGFDYPLENGDFIDILQSDNNSPSTEWLKYTKTKIAQRAIKGWTPQPANLSTHQKIKPIDVKSSIIIPEDLSFHTWRLCEKCIPYPPQDIYALIKSDGSVTVHRFDCVALQKADFVERLDWRRGILKPSKSILNIDAWDHIGLLEKIIHTISKRNVSIIGANIEAFTNGTAHIAISLLEGDDGVLEEISQDIREIPLIAQLNYTHKEPNNILSPGPSNSFYKRFNPYTPRPVGNQDIFFGRSDETQSVWSALEVSGRCNSILLWGQQRIGKTSLLMHLEAHARSEPTSLYWPIRFSLTSGEPKLKLTEWFFRQVVRNFHDKEKQPILKNLVDNFVGGSSSDVTAFIYEFINKINSLILPKRLLVILDEIQNINFYQENESRIFLEALQTIMDNVENVSFVFAGSGLFLKRESFPNSLLFLGSARNIRLGELKSDDAQDLIRRPMYPDTYSEGLVENIIYLTRGNPYYIHLICGSLKDYAIRENKTKVFSSDDLENTITQSFRNNRAPFTHLLNVSQYGEKLIREFAKATSLTDEAVSLNSIMPKLSNFLPEKTIKDTMQDLLDLDIMRPSEKDRESYQITLPIFHEWLKKEISI